MNRHKILRCKRGNPGTPMAARFSMTEISSLIVGLHGDEHAENNTRERDADPMTALLKDNPPHQLRP